MRMNDRDNTGRKEKLNPNWVYIAVVTGAAGGLLLVNRSSFEDVSASVFLFAWVALALLLVGLALSRQRLKILSIVLGLVSLLMGAVGLITQGVPATIAATSIPLAAAFAVRAFAPNRVVGGVVD